MNGLQALRGLGPIDAKSVGRDALLRWVIFIPILLALLTRWFVPGLVDYAESILAIEIQATYPPLLAYMLMLLVPNMVGFVIGFLLLDQRDDRTLFALQVTPLSLKGYLVYRLTMPVVLSFFLSLIVLVLSGLVELEWQFLLLACLSAAPMAPIFALGLAVLSQNKVQGFALMKVSGLVLMPPLAAYFIESNWQLLLGLIPTYWPAQTLWSAQAGANSFWFYLLTGLVYQLLFLWALVRRFVKIMHR